MRLYCSHVLSFEVPPLAKIRPNLDVAAFTCIIVQCKDSCFSVNV